MVQVYLPPAGRRRRWFAETERFAGQRRRKRFVKILVLNGPNMQLLGTREPDIYGSATYGDLVARLEAFGRSHGVDVVCHQSNHEGELLDRIAAAAGAFDGIVINPAALTHTSLALHDALKAVPVPAIEVHVSQVFSRGGVRSNLVTTPACRGMIAGLGLASYELAILALSSEFRDA
jgi:3-dehydroquinate dehydratase-2